MQFIVRHKNLRASTADGRFDHAPWERIKKDNMMVWLSWSCYNMRYDEVKADKEKMERMQTTLAMLEARTGTLFEEGYDPDIAIIRFSLDPVIVSWTALPPCAS